MKHAIFLFVNRYANHCFYRSTTAKLVVLLCAFAPFLLACNTTKHVPEGDHLLVRNEVKLLSPYKIKQKPLIEHELSKIVRPRHNRKVFGAPYALHFYNLLGKKNKGLLKNFTEKPALFSESELEPNKKRIKNHLFNLGFFSCSIRLDTINVSAQKRKLHYTVSTGKRNTIRSYAPITQNLHSASRFDTVIHRSMSESPYIKLGDAFNLNNLNAERIRICSQLRNEGYYFFKPEMLLFQVDTCTGNAELDIRLKVNEKTPKHELAAYHLGRIHVHYNQKAEKDTSHKIASQKKNMAFYGKQAFLTPHMVWRTLAIRTNQYYAEDKHRASKQNLQHLGIVNSANLSFSIRDTSTHQLDCDVFISKAKRYIVSANLGAEYRDIGFAGPSARFSFVDNDAFKAGYRFSVYALGQASFQAEPFEYKLINDKGYSIGGGVSLEVPTQINFPSKKHWQRSKSATVFSANWKRVIRPRYYSMASANSTIGYNWRPTAELNKTWNFFDISYFYLDNTTNTFDDALMQRPVLARSFENLLLLGSSFTAEKSQYRSEKDGYRWYLRLEAMGNLLHISQLNKQNQNWEPEPALKVYDIRYGQYVLAESEFSARKPINYRTTFAYRVAGGLGIPLGNSDVLPYTKQFFVGGANSVRAYRLRSIGPGGSPINEDGYYIEQTGDMKLEASMELRFTLDRFFELAVFSDLGNVWLLHKDENRPTAHFEIDRFWRELALGIGTGLRVTTGFVIMRLDMSIPLRHPGMPEGYRWTFLPNNLKYGHWDPRFQITVGYPF